MCSHSLQNNSFKSMSIEFMLQASIYKRKEWDQRKLINIHSNADILHEQSYKENDRCKRKSPNRNEHGIEQKRIDVKTSLDSDD